MRKISTLAIIAVIGVILGSCGNTNNVVNNKLISKRKYTKGFHLNQKGHFKSGQDIREEQDLMSASDSREESYFIASSDFGTKKAEVLTTREAGEVQKSNASTVANIQEQRSVNTINEKVEKSESIGYWSKEDLKKVIQKKELKRNASPSDDTVMLILLVILAIIIPPLAVFIFEGATSRFWIDLILAILGWGAFGLFGGIFWLCGLAAIIYALLIVLGAI
jgi:uncharacterized membrane protein YqaE (UPF0057 family)